MDLNNRTIIAIDGDVGVYNNVQDFVVQKLLAKRGDLVEKLREHASDTLNAGLSIASLLTGVVLDDIDFIKGVFEAFTEDEAKAVIEPIKDMAAAYSAKNVMEYFLDRELIDVMGIHWDVLFANDLINSPYPTEEFMEFIYEKTGEKEQITKKIISSSVQNDIFFAKRETPNVPMNLFPEFKPGFIIIDDGKITLANNPKDMLKIACDTKNLALILFFVEQINSGKTEYLNTIIAGIVQTDDNNLYENIFGKLDDIQSIAENIIEVSLMFDSKKILSHVYTNNTVDLKNLNWEFIIKEVGVKKTANAMQELMNVSNELDLIEDMYKKYSE